MFKEFLGWRAKAMHGLVTFAQPLYRRLSRRSQAPWNITKSELLNFPVYSLGRELGVFLDKNDYTLMAQFETHDVFHVLLEYEPTVLDEARMQYCLVGSGKKSLFALGTCFIAIVFYPEYAMDFKRHYQCGKSLENFSYWDFEALLDVDIIELRESLVLTVLTRDRLS